jgi:hypothetical protein
VCCDQLLHNSNKQRNGRVTRVTQLQRREQHKQGGSTRGTSIRFSDVPNFVTASSGCLLYPQFASCCCATLLTDDSARATPHTRNRWIHDACKTVTDASWHVLFSKIERPVLESSSCCTHHTISSSSHTSHVSSSCVPSRLPDTADTRYVGFNTSTSVD